jgi:hypothetical protein
MTRFALYAGLVAAMFSFAPALHASETGWSTAVNPLSPEAQQIRQQPLLERPNRPFHVYGNTVRRMHYRGSPLPTTRDFSGSAGGFFGR